MVALKARLGIAKSKLASSGVLSTVPRRMSHVGFIPALLLVLFLVVWPLGLMLGESFDGGVENYTWALTTESNRKVLWITFRTALITTVVAVLIAYPYAYAMTAVNKYLRFALFAFVLVPFWTNVTVRSFSWIAILENNGVLNTASEAVGGPKFALLGTSAAVTIAMVQILLPFAVLPLYAVMARVKPEYIHAAQGLGASPLRTFWRVYLPLTATGVISGAVLVFAVSLGFYITPALLGSPGDTMIAVLIQIQVGGLLNWGRAGALAAILLAMTFLVFAIGALAFALLRRAGGRRAQ